MSWWKFWNRPLTITILPSEDLKAIKEQEKQVFLQMAHEVSEREFKMKYRILEKPDLQGGTQYKPWVHGQSSVR